MTAASIQFGGMNLQTSLEQQQMFFQTMSNVSRLLHDAARTTIMNLRA